MLSDSEGTLRDSLGMEIPAEVLRQIRMNLDVPISRLSRSELNAAAMGFKDNGIVFEDTTGASTLLDKLHLTWDELPLPNAPAYAHQFEVPVAANSSWVDYVSNSFTVSADIEKPISFVERYLSEISENMIGIF